MPAPDLFVTTFSVTTSMSVLSGNFLPPRCQKKVEQQLERTKLTDLCLTSRDLYEHRRHYFNPTLHGGGHNGPPLAKSAPVHQGLHFE